jgi:ATP-binding cassette subfamily F protein 3
MNKKEARKLAAEKRKQLAPLKRAVVDAEKKVEKLEADKAAVDLELENPELYGDHDDDAARAVTRLQLKLRAIKEEIASAEAKWMKAEEAYTTAKNDAG